MYEILSNRDVIKIIGFDSVKFLQNLITNDICKSIVNSVEFGYKERGAKPIIIGKTMSNAVGESKLIDYNYCYTYLLNNQGRYLFDFFVYVHNPEEIYLDIDKSNKAALIKYLNFYKFRSKIQVIDCSNEYKVIYSLQKLDIDSLITVRDPRYAKLGFRSINKLDVIPLCGIQTIIKKDWTPWLSHRVTEGEPSSSKTSPCENGNPIYLEDKYNFAIIDGVEDLITDKSIPNMYGAEELNAISFDKGCYVGQEVISRTKYQGVIRRKIYKITADEDLSSLVKDEEILADNNKIGVICSSYHNKAIALIREEKYLADKEADVTVKGIKINLSLAPWY
ncbi:MAG: folate-binding protein YgfZ [Rickettsia africae]|uniref:GcvT-like putative aminomethyltransferase n=1 Tax=Rickettsia africae (strain ESF-5) TaxID=347255 RepID=C3PNT4_RICAE|nr:folate-binding protein YgfZ [Rickettsia africae]ACP53594.1 GcvT-like putative aminomethyltransferase [Rickettsia africae ESF-5]